MCCGSFTRSGYGGLLLFILRYAMMLMKTRSVLYEKINPRFELQE